jgi:hypothetical protein
MYGMVNQAVKELVLERHGADAWSRICKTAGLDEESFSSLQKYPDEVTFKLVGAASQVLGAPPEQILETFGEYWTDFAKRTSFSRLLRFGGATFAEFVQNLDQMHAKIKFSLPELEPPEFRVSDAVDGGFRLHYYSKRVGLAPLVKGMLRGVAKLYDLTLDIELVKARADGHDHDEFRVAFAPAAKDKAAA